MKRSRLQQQIDGVAALQDPVRWALYVYVAGRRREVGRDEAARALRISRELAAFHLDKLAAEGVLETSFRRLTTRTGPGAGRPAKLYRRSDRQLAVTLPPRRYDLAAHLLLSAAETTDTGAIAAALRKAAGAVGAAIGARARERAGAHPTSSRLLRGAMAELQDYGFEPVRSRSGEIVLTNCPFHALVEPHREMVCGMNLALMEGLIAGLHLSGIKAVLEAKPGICCVSLCPARPDADGQAKDSASS